MTHVSIRIYFNISLFNLKYDKTRIKYVIECLVIQRAAQYVGEKKRKERMSVKIELFILTKNILDESEILILSTTYIYTN